LAVNDKTTKQQQRQSSVLAVFISSYHDYF